MSAERHGPRPTGLPEALLLTGQAAAGAAMLLLEAGFFGPTLTGLLPGLALTAGGAGVGRPRLADRPVGGGGGGLGMASRGRAARPRAQGSRSRDGQRRKVNEMLPRNVKVTGPLAVTAAGAYLAVRRPWLRTGATRQEVRRPLPGDELVPGATLQATRATTVQAPAERIWPWLVQMGHGRAGWYSYDQWDNGGEPSADRVIPELQSLRVGQVIKDATGPFGFVVARLEPGRALVLRCTIHPVTGRVVKPSEVDPGSRGYARAFLDFSWAFALEPIDDRTTRLLVRVRYRHQRRPWVRLMVHGYELVDALFSRRMLAGIRSRAERPPLAEPAAA